jgi:hypothetical protein
MRSIVALAMTESNDPTPDVDRARGLLDLGLPDEALAAARQARRWRPAVRTFSLWRLTRFCASDCGPTPSRPHGEQ